MNLIFFSISLFVLSVIMVFNFRIKSMDLVFYSIF